jgi:hypothetical protein
MGGVASHRDGSQPLELEMLLGGAPMRAARGVLWGALVGVGFAVLFPPCVMQLALLLQEALGLGRAARVVGAATVAAMGVWSAPLRAVEALWDQPPALLQTAILALFWGGTGAAIGRLVGIAMQRMRDP